MGRLLKKLYKPRIVCLSGLWYCQSNRPELIFGSGATPREAYLNWKSQLEICGLYWVVFE